MGVEPSFPQLGSTPALSRYNLPMLTSLAVIPVVTNLLSFALYGIDKRRARLGAWRISERTLIVAALFGTVGALLGMSIFRHKTKKPKFSVGVPFIMVAKIILAIALLVFYLRSTH